MAGGFVPYKTTKEKPYENEAYIQTMIGDIEKRFECEIKKVLNNKKT